MNGPEKPDVVLDVLGLLCPLPVVRTAATIRRVAPGHLIEVLADDPAVEEDFPEWCDECGHELVSLAFAEGRYVIRIRRKG